MGGVFSGDKSPSRILEVDPGFAVTLYRPYPEIPQRSPEGVEGTEDGVAEKDCVAKPVVEGQRLLHFPGEVAEQDRCDHQAYHRGDHINEEQRHAYVT